MTKRVIADSYLQLVMWTNVIVIAVVALLSPAMTQVPEEDQAALDKVKTCMSTGFSASVDEVAKEAAVGPIAKFPILCSFWKVQLYSSSRDKALCS